VVVRSPARAQTTDARIGNVSRCVRLNCGGAFSRRLGSETAAVVRAKPTFAATFDINPPNHVGR